MKHSIPCKIDVLHTLGETAWIVSLASEVVPDTIRNISNLETGFLV